YKTAEGYDWHTIWLIPAGIAGVVVVLFIIFFKDRTSTETAKLDEKVVYNQEI
ncbi:MAG TPA: hypothetical protein VGD90_12270, partial [Sphingobacteriaceae bacterium]